MPRKVNVTSVKFKEFQTRYKEWCDGKKGWQALCYEKWAEIKADDTLLRGFYSQMKLDVEAQIAKQKRQLEKRRMMFGLPQKVLPKKQKMVLKAVSSPDKLQKQIHSQQAVSGLSTQATKTLGPASPSKFGRHGFLKPTTIESTKPRGRSAVLKSATTKVKKRSIEFKAATREYAKPAQEKAKVAIAATTAEIESLKSML